MIVLPFIRLLRAFVPRNLFPFRCRQVFALLVGTAATLGSQRAGLAQTASVTTLHSLAGPTNGTSPRAALLRGRDGNFYGTTQNGGPADQGSVFLLSPAGELTTLHTFGAVNLAASGSLVNRDGAVPSAGLIQGYDGNFYGTASAGGAYGHGTVFSVTAGGKFTTVHSFNTRDGANPTAALLQAADGRFYGVTESGGTYGCGTIFVISSSGVLTTLFHFTGGEGMRPRGALVQDGDGNLYGTTSSGGPGSGGTVFKLTPAGSLTVLYAFTGQPPDGGYPLAGLVQGRDGKLYGTTVRGGTDDQGSVFSITPAGTVTTLHNFTGYADGNFPNAPLIQVSDGTLYGTTINKAFKMTPDGQFTTLATLDGGSGGPDQAGAGLIAGTDGNLYGTLAYTSINRWGGVYKLTPAGTVNSIHAFDRGGSEGDSPQAKLMPLSDGSFYGTAARGGERDLGAVFALASDNSFKALHQFGPAEAGYVPQGNLIQGRDGKLYGTTAYGNGNGGTVFSITSAGSLETVYCFPADGSVGVHPQAGLVQSRDGKFYGTTSSGGSAANNGTVFALSPGGTLINLHAFNGGDGSLSYASLVQGSDGKYYGTTAKGGTAGQGTVFAVNSAGSYFTLHHFTGSDGSDPVTSGDGAAPFSELVQGSNGNFYGTTSQGGDYTNGAVFVITPAGALNVLHSFGSATDDGIYPEGGLVQGGDGNFYGTTFGGGAYGQGTAFMITPGGALTTIYHFAGGDGAKPSSTLVRASDGNLYGVTISGGLYGLGTVYRLMPNGTAPTAPPTPDAQVTSVHPANVSQGDNGDAFGLTVANVGGADTSGTVTVTVTPGQGLYIAALSGPGWTCTRDGGNAGGWTCSRADALGSGHYFPMLTASVNVSPDASTAQGGSLTSRVAAVGDVHAANDSSVDAFPINAAASTPTQRWRYQYFHTTANSGGAADNANPTGDGISNLLKYALGLDPTVAGVSPITVDTSTGYLRLTTPKNANATDVTYTVQVSGDLSDPLGWTTNDTTVTQNTAALLQVMDKVPAKGTSKRFIRLRVSR